MIIGQPGSGKSTMARRLGEVTGLPVVHIDMIHWKPGWVERERHEKSRLCHEVHVREAWIFEGGHSTTWPERLDRADTVIWLDVPLPVRLRRVVWRTLASYGQSRPDLPEGCPERFDAEFYRFIWRTRKTARKNIQELLAGAPPEKRVFRLVTLRDVDRFLAESFGLSSEETSDFCQEPTRVFFMRKVPKVAELSHARIRQAFGRAFGHGWWYGSVLRAGQEQDVCGDARKVA